MGKKLEHIYLDCGPPDEEIEERSCTFTYPRIGIAEWDIFYDTQELWHAGYDEEAEVAFRQLVDRFPEFIDAWHHLAMLLEDVGSEEEAFQIWEGTVAMVLDCFPDSFRPGKDRVMWGYLENRPFLRAYHGYALALRERGRIDEALVIFEHILALNPNDNQGVRGLAAAAYFELRRPEAVLELCASYPGDGTEELVYGLPLALLQLGRAADAERGLDRAIGEYPLIAEELIKARHRKPPELNPYGVALWSPEQAYLYWKSCGKYWKRTPGALDLVRSRLQRARDLGLAKTLELAD